MTPNLTALAALSFFGASLTAPPLAIASPIHDAARQADISLVASLIRNGADIDERSADGSTALMIAARGGETELVDVLLILGADPEAHDNAGTSPLRAAVLAGDAASARLIVARTRALLQLGRDD